MTAPNPIRRWFVITVALILYSGTATAAVFGVLLASHAVDCLNNTLGSRNGPQAADAVAHITYAKAGKRYDDALVAVVTAPPKSARQAAAYKRFVAASREKSRADAAYIGALTADQAYRDAHPFGKC